eukprot:9959834-Alexandrium_andersonii.AAC.1
MDASGWVDLEALCSAMQRNNCRRGSRPNGGRSFYDKAWVIWSLMADAKKGGTRHKQRFEFAGVLAEPDANDAVD